MARFVLPLLVSGLVGLAVTACEAPRLTRHQMEPHTAQSFWTYAGAGQTFLLEVHNPPPGATPDGIARAFPSPPMVTPAAGFTTEAAQASRPDYRFLLMFGAPVYMDGNDACAGRAPVLKGGDSIQAAFCYRDRSISAVRADGVADAFSSGADDPAAHRVLYDVSRHLVPPFGWKDGDRLRPEDD